ncbi:hypothetical protein GT037_009263 [Alternaria burnsii]|uniref:Macro domain-containing protein n=1 Tax=Alternaria burnsii TaxID=1187904 RepID=A0A8H7B0N9_9PLEO|nr:uncharacterized protein GT037_009263 [Alternaria burnsii]KAF7672762.1 hypothetical protein GT037_009263 [Alternaria burnsii]
MSTLRLATAANIRAFQILTDALSVSDSKSTEEVDGDALEDEIGRFRVWAGNLGALQKGHSSLDYRLRDSPNLLSSALKLLNELEHNLNETFAVISGARLPYEAQTSTEEVEEDENDDGFFSEEDDSDSDGPRSELKMRFEEVVDIIDNLYKLSVRIRTPSIHSRSLKASSYMPKDPETGVDILDAYAELDRKHVQELLLQLRKQHPSGAQEEQASLVERLSSSITLRRRHFKYWKRHRDKLGASVIPEEAPEPVVPASREAPNTIRNENLEAFPTTPMITTSRPTPSQKTGKTLLSGTEVTHHHQSLDDIVDTKSVTSYAVTVRDLHGKGIELPPPPKAANGDKDFECSYCWIVCPARYGKGRAWKTHLLQDLQPYICTYEDCESSQQLFRSRREWAEHEATHRKLWRCPEHAAALYSSVSGLETHLRQDHNGSFPEDQIAVIAKIGETTAMDTRTKCPICYVPADTAGLGDLQSHIANHLERFATFALPHGREDDADGASSIASRGSSKSQSLPDSVRTDTSIDEIELEDTAKLEDSSEILHVKEPGQNLLSAERLQQLPDESHNRFALIASQSNDLEDSEEEQPDDQIDEDVSLSHKKHLDHVEAFRQHVLTLPGALSVRFYRRYGSWRGSITFADDWVGEEALKVFDTQRFPNMDFKPKKDTSKWNFTRINLPDKKEHTFNRQSTADTQATEDAETFSTGSELYDQEVEDSEKQAIISTADIPTLRSLYQSRRLLQRDQSFAPNDAYNQMISFCHYDLTRMRVDAIVNNAPSNFKAQPDPKSLHYVIYQRGGSGLRNEARSKPRVKAGQVELTHGHDLPASWVIHAAAPTYTGSKGVGQFNILSACYREALRTAATYEFKTIAFPCLGTGGCNFPPRVAARIALQEIREYLDAHPEHRPERIIFCVKAAIDEKAYTDFLPVFFPPTHGDLDRARTSDWSANRAALSAQILEARTQLQKALTDMSDTYVFRSQTAETNVCAHDMRRVDSALLSIRNYLLGSKELKRSLADLNLLCSVISTACSTISEIAERAKEVGFTKEEQNFWDEANTGMQASHGFDLSTLFDYCWMFANSLDGVIAGDRKEPDSMARARQVLENYAVKQKSQNAKGIRDHLDEVIHVRKSEAPISNNREIIQVHQIPSVARLYLLGDLEAKPTMAQPSTSFNHTVCLLREDITRLAVDVMVNSTDVSFSGMGTLDRTVFKKGGPGLRWEVEAEQIGPCKVGDVKVTPPFLLPAKHVVHVVPPGQFRKDTKTILRGIYREILHTAVELRATSVAIPSIGTGMLNYPRRDCASLAMEEVKRFLESAEPANVLHKIIFVVFSSNDEFVYKSLLPVYFPPPKRKVSDASQREEQTSAQHQAAMTIDDHMRNEAEREEKKHEIRERFAQDTPLPASVRQTEETREDSSSSKPSATILPASSDLRKLSEVNEEVRQMRYRQIIQQTQMWTHESRPMDKSEEHALFQFESHVDDCDTCHNGLYERRHELCQQGYRLGEDIWQRVEMSPHANVHARRDRYKLEVPADRLPSSMLLLSTIAQSATQSTQTESGLGDPFFQTVTPREVKPKDPAHEDGNASHHSAVEVANSTASVTEPPGVIHASVLAPLTFGDWVHSILHIHRSKIELYHTNNYSEGNPYATIDLRGASSSLTRGATLDYSNQQGQARAADYQQALSYHNWMLKNGYPNHPPPSPRTPDASAVRLPPHATSLLVEKLEEMEGKGTQRVDRIRVMERWHFLDALAPEAPALFDALQRLVNRNNKTQRDLATLWTIGNETDKDYLDKREKGLQSSAHVSKDVASSSAGGPDDMKPTLGEDTQSEKILAYLSYDLKTRSGSYIGQTTNKIADAVDIDVGLVNTVLHTLAAHGRVHNTINDDTWVISEEAKELPPIEQVLRPPESGDGYPFTSAGPSTLADRIVSCLSTRAQGLSLKDFGRELQASDSELVMMIHSLALNGYIAFEDDKRTWILTDLGEQKAVEIRVRGERDAIRDTETFAPNENSPSELSERALSYLKSLPGISENISDLAATFDTPVAELRPVLDKLESEGLVEHQDDNSSWTASLSTNQQADIPHPPMYPSASTRDHRPVSPQLRHTRSLDFNSPTPPGIRTPSLRSTSPAVESTMETSHIDDESSETRSRVSRGEQMFHRFNLPNPTSYRGPEFPHNDYFVPEQQDVERPAIEAKRSTEGSSWRDGTGAKQRKQTRSTREIAEDIDEDLQEGTASSLRRARMAKEKKHKRSSKVAAKDIDDELEYYDGQEEDFVDDEEDTKVQGQ